MTAPSAAVIWTRRIVTLAAILIASAVVLAMVLRVGFPLELEWMEGGVLHQAHRHLHGQDIYPPPSRDFVPFLYTPGLPLLLGGLGRVLPLGFVLGRVVSIVACVAIGWGLWRAVALAGKPRAHQAAAVGLFCAGYVFTFRWLDLTRPDALYMALTLWGLVHLRQCSGSHRRAAVAGLLMALAFWTKQTAATFILASGLGAFLVAPRQLPTYVLTVAVVDGGGVLLGNAVTDGRLWHYIYELHQSHAFNDERFEKKTWGMFVHAGPFVLAAGALGLGALVSRLKRTPGPQRLSAVRDSAFWLLMALTGLLVSGLGYATQWAEPNAFIPGVVMGAVFVAVVLPAGGTTEVAASGLVLAQMVFAAVLEPTYQPLQSQGWSWTAWTRSYIWQDPGRTIPSEAAWVRAAQLRAELEAVDGKVLALQRPWWAVLAGSDADSGHIGTMGINDVLPEDRKAIQKTLSAELSQTAFDQVWIEGEPPRWMLRGLSRYTVKRRRHGSDRVRPMSGYMSVAGMVTPYRADQVLYTPAGPRPQPEGTTVLADFEDGRLNGFEITGRAFGRQAARGVSSRMPPVGPLGGAYMLSSATGMGDLKRTGSALSPVFVVSARGRLEVLLGVSRRSDRLAVEIVDAENPERSVSLPLPRQPHAMASVRWDPGADWAGHAVRLRLGDNAKNAAIFVDDVWLIDG